jgi:hypothetical protein
MVEATRYASGASRSPPEKDQPYLGIAVANTGAQVMHELWVMECPFAKIKLLRINLLDYSVNDMQDRADSGILFCPGHALYRTLADQTPSSAVCGKGLPAVWREQNTPVARRPRWLVPGTPPETNTRPIAIKRQEEHEPILALLIVTLGKAQ